MSSLKKIPLALRLPGLILLLAAAILSAFYLTRRSQSDPAPYRYLAIGNSITRHPVCDFWWDEIGMAASRPENDYYHQVTAWLAEEHPLLEAQAVNYVEWENASDRDVTYPVIDPYLTGNLDLITLQLSENATHLKGFEKSCAALIRHIREKCPNAKIVLVDDFWSDQKSDMKRRAAQKTGVPFADLSAIRGDAAYQCSVGDPVYGADGQAHLIDREMVAKHPNDAGMAYIAQAIIDCLR